MTSMLTVHALLSGIQLLARILQDSCLVQDGTPLLSATRETMTFHFQPLVFSPGALLASSCIFIPSAGDLCGARKILSELQLFGAQS